MHSGSKLTGNTDNSDGATLEGAVYSLMAVLQLSTTEKLVTTLSRTATIKWEGECL
jgi:hypothetical protein